MSSLPRSIRDEFEVLEYLGKSGKVLRARQRALDRQVVLKVMNPKFYDPEAARAKFIEEGRLLARIEHPNVVRVLSVEDREGEDPYLVMECVEGTSLKRLLKKEKKIRFADACKYLEGICAALDGIHEHGIVHRNLKPENLLVDGEGRIKLVDFGLALSPDQAADGEGDVVLGTPIYMSPEQVRGKPLDARSDVYAAGVIGFELMTGRPPYLGRDPRAIMKAHVKQPVPDPEEWDRRLPRPVMHVLKRALAKKPDERYETAAKLRERVVALGNAAEGSEDLSAVMRLKAERTRSRDRKRSRNRRGLLAAVALVGLGAAGVRFWLEAARNLDSSKVDERVGVQAQGGRLTIEWSSKESVETLVEYGYADPPNLVQKVPGARSQHRVVLPDLQPGRKVWFRVQLGEGRFSPVASRQLATAWSLSDLVVDPGKVRAQLRFTSSFPARPVVSWSDDLEGKIWQKLRARTPATDHAFELTGLVAGKPHKVRVDLREPGRPPEYREVTFEALEVVATQLYSAAGGAGIEGAPALAGDRVLLGTAAGKLVALERASGTPVWQVDLPGPSRGTPVVDGDAVVLKAGERTLVCRALADGSERWQVELPAPIVGDPVIGGGVAAVTLETGRTVALLREGGVQVWSRDAGAQPSAGPAVQADEGPFELVAGFRDGLLRGLGPGGAPRWHQPVGARAESAPVFHGKAVAVAGEGTVLRMRESRKAPRWTADVGAGAYALAVSDELAVVATRDAGLVALSWAEGRERWRVELGGGAQGLPRIRDGKVYATSGDGTVVCVDLARGKRLWEARLGAGSAAGPVPADEGCYVATFGGQLYRFDD